MQIYGHNLELTPELMEHIQGEIQSLKKFIDRKTWDEAKIEVGRTTRHHRKGEVFRAEINLPLPAKLLRAEEVSENLHTAINIVKEEIERQVKKYLGKKEEWR
jgi:ribosomal subunit interface protein